MGRRAAPRWRDALVLHRWLARVLRAAVLAALVFVTAAAAFGSTILNRNIAPVAIFVVWWIGWCRSPCCWATCGGK